MIFNFLPHCFIFSTGQREIYVKVVHREKSLLYKFSDGKFFEIPKQDFNFARVKTGQVGT